MGNKMAAVLADDVASPDEPEDVNGKLTDLQDRFDECKEELAEFESLHGKRDTDYEKMLEHWKKCYKSLEEYKRREGQTQVEIDQLKENAIVAKELYRDREKELSERIKELESKEGRKVKEDLVAKEIERLKRGKDRAEADSAELFQKFDELRNAHSKLQDQYKVQEDKAFELGKENEKLKQELLMIEMKYKAQDFVFDNIKDCTRDLEKAQYELKEKEDHLGKCAESSDKCFKSRAVSF